MMFGYKTKANFTVENENADIRRPPKVDFGQAARSRRQPPRAASDP